MVVVAIDAGTTGVRCMLVTKDGVPISISRRRWDYVTPPDLEIAKEFDPDHFWHLVCTVVKEALKTSKTNIGDLETVATTSQRHGSVFLDKKGKEVYAGPNIDARGAMTQYIIEESLGEKYHEITGCWPPLMFSPSRLSWYEEEEPEIFESIAHILPINDWITYKLGNIFTTDLSSGSATGFMDIRKCAWSEEVVKAVGTSTDILPEIHESGAVVGEVTMDAERACGLPKGLSIVQGAADTHCALLASDAQPNDIVIIAGGTAPVMMILNDLYCEPEQKIWTSCDLQKGRWVLESNATLTGANLDWVVRLLCERAENPENCAKTTLDSLDELLADIPPGSNEILVGLGPSIMDCQRITDVKQARMTFPQPTLPSVVPLTSATMIHAVLENIAYAAFGNVEQLETHLESTCIKTIGGMTQSKIWSNLLANIIGRPIHIPAQPEGSLLGAAICAAKGANHYETVFDAAKNMVKWKPVVEPDDRANLYKSYYAKWKNMWCEGV